MIRITKYFTLKTYLQHAVTTIKLLLGFIMLYLSIRGIQWQSLVTSIGNANQPWLLLAFVSVQFGLLLKLWRWSIFMKNYCIKTNLTTLFSAYFVGQATNIVLPFRGGELIRMGYFHKSPESLPGVASTILLEKYLDLLFLTFSGILVSLQVSIDNILNLRGLLLPVIIVLSVLLVLAVFFGPALWVFVRPIKWLPARFVGLMDEWLKSSQWLKNPKKVLPGVILTAVIWIVMWSTNLILFKSLGITQGGTAAGMVLILVYVGLLPALMPGNIGPFYFFTQLALIPFVVVHDQALAFAVVLHAIVTLPPILGGLIGLLLRNRSLVNT